MTSPIKHFTPINSALFDIPLTHSPTLYLSLKHTVKQQPLIPVAQPAIIHHWLMQMCMWMISFDWHKGELYKGPRFGVLSSELLMQSFVHLEATDLTAGQEPISMEKAPKS